MAYCNWDTSSDLNIRYHDEEWGVPLHDDHGSDCPCYRKIVENYPTVVKRRYLEKHIGFFGDN